MSQAKSIWSQPNLSAPEPPALLEYTPLGGAERWRVEQFSDFVVEFGLSGDWAERMAKFHAVAVTYQRQWKLARQLFGINPMILPEDAAPEDFQTLTRLAICERYGLEKASLQAELDALRAVWGQVDKTPERVVSSTPAPARSKKADPLTPTLSPSAGEREKLPPPPPSGPDAPSEETDEAVLRACGFDAKMFEGVQVYDADTDKTVRRDPEKNRSEREWFAKRCREWRAMFSEPSARTTVREALLAELNLSRIQDEMAAITPGMRVYEKFEKLKTSVWDRYQKQLARVEEMFPDLNTAGRTSFRQVVSTLIGAEQDFYGDGNHARRDALFTAAEIQVLLRQSVQNPQPQYRFSTSLLVTEAVHGLYDREFRSTLGKQPGLLRKIDAAVRAAIDAAREAQHEPLVNLEVGVLPDEGDNFEDLIEFESGEKPANDANED